LEKKTVLCDVIFDAIKLESLYCYDVIITMSI